MTTTFEFSLDRLLRTSGLAGEQAYIDYFRDVCAQRVLEANNVIFHMADGQAEWGVDTEQRLRAATASVRLHIGFLRRAELHFEGKPEIARRITSRRETAEDHAARALVHAKELAMMFDPLRTQTQ